MPPFLPGLELCRLYYRDAVRPLLDREYPDLVYSAARIDSGSEVLGFDTERSTDHEWGPQLQLFLAPRDADGVGGAVSALLAAELPTQVRGWPTHFEPPGERIRQMAASPTGGPVAHRVEVTDLTSWCVGQLGFDPLAGAGPRTLDWLATPTQRLAGATSGAVYHDGLGTLGEARARLRWYPEDVWRYVLASQWVRISQEEAFVGRTAEAGDDLGSRVLAARMVRELMRMALLLRRRYPPYSKWLGTAFARLPGGSPVAELLRAALASNDAGERQAHLGHAYTAVAGWQNATGLADALDTATRPFLDRPYPVLDAGRFAAALLARITDPVLARTPPVGAVDQFVDSTDVLERPALFRGLTAVVVPPATESDRAASRMGAQL